MYVIHCMDIGVFDMPNSLRMQYSININILQNSLININNFLINIFQKFLSDINIDICQNFRSEIDINISLKMQGKV